MILFGRRELFDERPPVNIGCLCGFTSIKTLRVPNSGKSWDFGVYDLLVHFIGDK